MSQPDLLTQLRAARPVAPPELREHVRLLAAEAATPRRRITWRRAFVVVVPVAIAAAAGAFALTRSGSPAHDVVEANAPYNPTAHATDRAAGTNSGQALGALTPSAAASKAAPARAAIPAPSASRVQQYAASLGLRLKNADAVSEATQLAVRIAGSLGGHLTSVNVEAEGRSGYANLVLRVPVGRVREAVGRLAALGTVVSESVSIKDLQGQVDATAARVRRLQRLVVSERALPQTEETIKRIDALTAQIERLKRGRSATVRTASLATVHLQLTSRQAPVPLHHGRGPLHRLGVIFRWAAIGAVYALALGAPPAALLAIGWIAVRTLRRRREDELLSSR